MSRRVPRLLLAGGILSGAILSGAPATAGDSRANPSQSATSERVEVFLKGDADWLEGASDAIRELFGRLGIDASVHFIHATEDSWPSLSPTRPAPLARAFVDIRPASPSIILFEGSTRRIVERRLLPASTSPELLVEETAHVLQAMVDSLLPTPSKPVVSSDLLTDADGSSPREGAADRKPPNLMPARDLRGHEVERAAAPTPPGRTPTSSTPDWGLDAQIFAEGLGYGGLWHGGGGAGLAASLRGRGIHVGLAVEAAALVPSRYEIVEGTALVRGGSVRIAPVVNWTPSSWWSVGCRLGAGLDALFVEPHPANDTVHARGSVSDLEPLVTVGMALHVLAVGPVELLGGANLDVVVAPHRYILDGPSGPRAVFEPGRWRPSFMAGVSFALAGLPRFRPAGAGRGQAP